VQHAGVDSRLPERFHLRRLPERIEHGQLHPNLHEQERLPQRLQLQRHHGHDGEGLPVAAGDACDGLTRRALDEIPK
jgi:hypothetical protein